MVTYDLVLEALGDPTRRTIFERLGERPYAVGELAALLPVTRPAVSQHLKVLKDAGLVADTKDGNRRIYRLDPAGIDELRAYLDRFWGTALGAFKSAAEGRTGGQASPRSGASDARRVPPEQERSHPNQNGPTRRRQRDE